MGIRELWPTWPQTIIWDTQGMVERFHEQLPQYLRDSDWFEGSIRDLMEYIADCETANHYVEEWMQDWLGDANQRGFANSELMIKDAMQQLGYSMVLDVTVLGMYAYKNVWPYRFCAFMDFDIVLEKLDLEELVFLDSGPAEGGP